MSLQFISFQRFGLLCLLFEYCYLFLVYLFASFLYLVFYMCLATSIGGTISRAVITELCDTDKHAWQWNKTQHRWLRSGKIRESGEPRVERESPARPGWCSAIEARRRESAPVRPSWCRARAPRRQHRRGSLPGPGQAPSRCSSSFLLRHNEKGRFEEPGSLAATTALWWRHLAQRNTRLLYLSCC